MSLKKKLTIIFSSIGAFLLIFCFTAFLIINGYLNKINYNSGIKSLTSDIGSDLENDNVYDSPQTDIDVLNAEIEENLKDKSTPLNYDNDVFNILLISSDTRESGGSGRSDSMILISINKRTSNIITISLLRDIYLQIPGITLGNRLNAAYAYGGAALLLDTIQKNFKIQVDKYIAIDFFSFMDFIDKIGGVTIDISDAEMEVANDYIEDINRLKGLPEDDEILIESGTLNLNGKQALGYSRNRYVGNADFARTDRQRLVLQQVFSKVKTQNIIQLNDLLNTLLPEITTNLSKGELFSLILNIPTYANYTTDSLHIPIDGSFSYLTVRKMSVIGIDFEKNTAEMQKRIYD